MRFHINAGVDGELRSYDHEADDALDAAQDALDRADHERLKSGAQLGAVTRVQIDVLRDDS